MKRFFAILVLCIALAAMLSCNYPVQPVENEPNSGVISHMPVFIFPPAYCSLDFTYMGTDNRFGNKTEYYTPKPMWDSEKKEVYDPCPVRDDPVEVTTSRVGTTNHYHLDGQDYIEVNNSIRGVGYYQYYEWSFDRRFFYEYAQCTDGGKIYKNNTFNIDDAYIYVTADGNEKLLFKRGSAFTSVGNYQLEDFGAVILDNIIFDNAELYADVFYAHTKGLTAEKSDIDTAERVGFDIIHITLECMRIPGLRYSFSILWDGSTVYAYNRTKKQLVSFDTVDPYFQHYTEYYRELVDYYTSLGVV